jgi:hypothetical protein
VSQKLTRTKVERAARRLADAHIARDVALVEARAAGMSLRELADASDLGVETVRRILKSKGIA